MAAICTPIFQLFIWTGRVYNNIFDFVCLANGKVLKIIHNYGHGGGGVTLAWGCAKDVLNIVEKMWNEAEEISTTMTGTTTQHDRLGEKRGNSECSQQDDGKVNFKCKL